MSKRKTNTYELARKSKLAPVLTVGQLIHQLNDLPPDLEIRQGMGEGVRFNIAEVMGEGVCVLEFQDVEEDF